MKNKYIQLFGYLISVFLIYVLFRNARIDEFRWIIGQYRATDILLLFCVLLAGYFIRTWRWKVLLNAARLSYGFGELYINFVISIGINNLVPLRAGDVYRVLGVEGSATKGQLLGTLFVERILDAFSLVLLFLLWTLIGGVAFSYKVLYFPAIFIVVLALLGLMSYYFSKNNSRMPVLQKYKEIIYRFFVQLKDFVSYKVLLFSLIISLAGWLPETLIFYLVSKQQHLLVSYTSTALTHSAATLSTMVPSSPGFIGTFHYASYTVMSGAGVSSDQSLVFATLVHFFLWAPSVVLLPFFLILKRFGFIDKNHKR